MTPEEIEQSILTIGTAILTMEATLSELSATVNILLNQVANDMRPDDPMGALKILHTLVRRKHLRVIRTPKKSKPRAKFSKN